MFFENVHFWGPNWVGGAWYGIFLIREKPALRAGLINPQLIQETDGLHLIFGQVLCVFVTLTDGLEYKVYTPGGRWTTPDIWLCMCIINPSCSYLMQKYKHRVEKSWLKTNPFFVIKFETTQRWCLVICWFCDKSHTWQDCDWCVLLELAKNFF